MTIRNSQECKPGLDWDTWQGAGREWAGKTWATTGGAIALAAACFATKTPGDNERKARIRAFSEGARKAIAKAKGK
jgi:hypothetical protein